MSWYRNWPYAAKAIVQHESVAPNLIAWVTFRHPMNTDNTPANDKWKFAIDAAPFVATVATWMDEYTLRLIVAAIGAAPDRVTLEYDGPDPDLATVWDKQWEPWGPILSEEVPWEFGTLTFSTGPAQQNDVDVAGIKILFLDCSANDITIGGFVGGVNGQVLHIAKICAAAQDVTLKHIDLANTQKLYLHAGGDETLHGEYGGWALACNGTGWYDMSHAKHV